MSYQASHWARDQRTGSAPRKCVLLVLAEHVGPQRTCFISIATIAKRAELGRTTVIKALAAMERDGLIARRRRHGAHGHRTTDEVELLFGLPAHDASAEHGQAGQGSGGELAQTAKVHDTSHLGAAREHEKVIEKEESARASHYQRMTPIPDGFPDQDAIEKERAFLSRRNVHLDICLEAEKFRAHALAQGRGAVDWQAAFHTWVIKSVEHGLASRAASMYAEAPELPPDADVWRPRLREFSKNGFWNRTDWGAAPGREGCQVPEPLLIEILGPPAGRGRGESET